MVYCIPVARGASRCIARGILISPPPVIPPRVSTCTYQFIKLKAFPGESWLSRNDTGEMSCSKKPFRPEETRLMEICLDNSMFLTPPTKPVPLNSIQPARCPTNHDFQRFLSRDSHSSMGTIFSSAFFSTWLDFGIPCNRWD